MFQHNTPETFNVYLFCFHFFCGKEINNNKIQFKVHFTTHVRSGNFTIGFVYYESVGKRKFQKNIYVDMKESEIVVGILLGIGCLKRTRDIMEVISLAYF